MTPPSRFRSSFCTTALKSSTADNRKGLLKLGATTSPPATTTASKRRLTIGCNLELSSSSVTAASSLSATGNGRDGTKNSTVTSCSTSTVAAASRRSFSLQQANAVFFLEASRRFEDYRRGEEIAPSSEADVPHEEYGEQENKVRSSTKEETKPELSKHHDDEESITRTSVTSSSTAFLSLPSSPAPSSSSKSPRVHFADTAELRQYPLVLGDNPSVWKGPPVALDWNWSSQETMDMKQEKFLFPSPRRRSAQERETILKQAGYPSTEITQGSKDAAISRRQRSQSRRETTTASRALERWERLRRNLNNLMSFGAIRRREREYLKQCGVVVVHGGSSSRGRRKPCTTHERTSTGVVT